MKNDIAHRTILRFLRLLLVSFLGAGTTSVTVYGQHVFLGDGELNYKAAMGAASTAFLVSFAGSVLHGLELFCGESSNQGTPPVLVQKPSSPKKEP